MKNVLNLRIELHQVLVDISLICEMNGVDRRCSRTIFCGGGSSARLGRFLPDTSFSQRSLKP